MLTIQQRIASFQLSYSMCMAAQLKAKEKVKTAIWNRLDQLEDYLGRALDYYRIEYFRPCDLKRAEKLFNRLDKEIANLYPSRRVKQQRRRYHRHNQCRVQRAIRTTHKKGA